MTDKIISLTTTKPEAEIAADLKERAKAALVPLTDLMAEAARAGLLLAWDNIGPDAFGRFHVHGLKVIKHY